MISVAVPGVIVVSVGTDWSWQYWVMGIGFGWGFGELGYRFRHPDLDEALRSELQDT